MKRFVTLLVLVVITISCTHEPKEIVYNLNGYAQKGPFAAGADVTIIELDANLNPTGKTYFSTIEDNRGFFAFPSVGFLSNFIKLKVNGVYFNEIYGGYVGNEETLYSIVDLGDNKSVNINIMTHLQQARIDELLRLGVGFHDAMNQSFNEYLAIFNLENLELNAPNEIDITGSDISSGALMVTSAIIQYNIASGMIFQEYLTNLLTDFKVDGKIDSPILQLSLGTSGLVLNIDRVRQNLIDKYNDMGLTINPHNAHHLLRLFNENTQFPTLFDNLFTCMVNGAQNLICLGDTTCIDLSNSFTIAINDLTESGISSIQVVITSADENFSTSNVNWYFDGNTRRFLYVGGNNLDIPITFNGSGSMLLELFVVLNGARMVEYPKKFIVWGEK